MREYRSAAQGAECEPHIAFISLVFLIKNPVRHRHAPCSSSKPSRWQKRVKLDDIRDVPRAAYVDSLMKAAEAGDGREVDRLCDEECRQVLAEMRLNP
jgi:hypothetical protein